MVNRQESGVVLTATSATPAIVIEDGLPPPGPLSPRTHVRTCSLLRGPKRRWICVVPLPCAPQAVSLVRQMVRPHPGIIAHLAFVPAQALFPVVQRKLGERLFPMTFRAKPVPRANALNLCCAAFAEPPVASRARVVFEPAERLLDAAAGASLHGFHHRTRPPPPSSRCVGHL
jgi:hypothetical protein